MTGRCPPDPCRIVWRPAPTICRVSPGCWRTAVRPPTDAGGACRERQLAAEAVRRLKAPAGVEVFTPATAPIPPVWCPSGRRAGTAKKLAEALGRRGIALRAGLHCAPLAHRTAGTLDTGTVRLSLSDFNTPAQIEKLAQELHQLFVRLSDRGAAYDRPSRYPKCWAKRASPAACRSAQKAV